MKIRNFAFFGVMAAIFATANAYAEKKIASTNYVDAKIVNDSTNQGLINSSSTTTAPSEKTVYDAISNMQSVLEDAIDDIPDQAQADWLQSNAEAVDFIKNKPTLGTAAATDSTAYDPAGSAAAAQSAAIAAAATDATTKANAAESAAKSYADGLIENSINSAHTTIAPSGHAVYEAIQSASAATNFVENAINSGVTAKAPSEDAVYTALQSADTAAQSYASTAQANAISSAATDATTKANAAQSAAEDYADSAVNSAIEALAYEVDVDPGHVITRIQGINGIPQNVATTAMVRSGDNAYDIANPGTFQAPSIAAVKGMVRQSTATGGGVRDIDSAADNVVPTEKAVRSAIASAAYDDAALQSAVSAAQSTADAAAAAASAAQSTADTAVTNAATAQSAAEAAQSTANAAQSAAATAQSAAEAAQSTANGKVTANAAITGATKTKITYDSKGLVTAGEDVTYQDISVTGVTHIENGTCTPANPCVLTYEGNGTYKWTNVASMDDSE